MLYIGSRSLPYIKNTGSTDAQVIITFCHEKPKDFALQASFGAMNDAALGNIYDQPAGHRSKIPRDTQERHLIKRLGAARHHPNGQATQYGDPHKFDVEGMIGPVDSSIGSAKTARKQFWLILDDINMYSLRVEEDGMRGPHWHPETMNMGYVHQGRAGISIMDPDRVLIRVRSRGGMCTIFPHAYPHQIEVAGEEQIHSLIFFDQPMPKDVGCRASALLVGRDILAATFGVREEESLVFPFTVRDPLIVGRVNERDPVDRQEGIEGVKAPNGHISR